MNSWCGSGGDEEEKEGKEGGREEGRKGKRVKSMCVCVGVR